MPISSSSFSSFTSKCVLGSRTKGFSSFVFFATWFYFRWWLGYSSLQFRPRMLLSVFFNTPFCQSCSSFYGSIIGSFPFRRVSHHTLYISYTHPFYVFIYTKIPFQIKIFSCRKLKLKSIYLKRLNIDIIFKSCENTEFYNLFLLKGKTEEIF